MASIQRSFYLLNARAICIIFLITEHKVFLSQRYVRRDDDAKNPTILIVVNFLCNWKDPFKCIARLFQEFSYSWRSAENSARKIKKRGERKRHCYDKVVVVLAKSTLSLQSSRCPCKVDVLRTKLSLSLQSRRSSYKVVVVLCTKLTLFAQSFVQRKKKVGKLILI